MPSTQTNSAIRVGTASWSEPEFVRAGWYPPSLPPRQRLEYYAERFDMVELNSSFYAIPTREMYARWVASTPDNFLFDVKCFRLLSRHATDPAALPKRLQNSVEKSPRGNVVLTAALEEEVAGQFLANLAPLEQAGKLGALLLQMSPSFAPFSGDLTALEPLFRQLRGSGKNPRKVVLELRHRAWLDQVRRRDTFDYLSDQGITLASIDGPPSSHAYSTIMPGDDVITEPRLAYLRLHGRDAKAYLTGQSIAERFNYDYNESEIDEIAHRVESLSERVDSVLAVFNNNAHDYAPDAAERLRLRLRQINRRSSAPPVQTTLF